MTRYIVERLLWTVPVVIGVSVIVFLILHLTPGDPADVMLGPEATPEAIERLHRDLGLDRPLYTQYGLWIGRVARADLGFSYTIRAPVLDLVMAKFKNTLLLVVTGLAFSTILGMAAGMIAATHQNSWVDRAISATTLFGVSMPVFWLGIMLIMLFAVRLSWFPSAGMSSSGGGGVRDVLHHLVLPALTIAVASLGTVARFMRSAALEVMSQDYVRTARAKGLSEQRTHLVHTFKNALIPVITVVGMQIGYLLGGAVLTETVFSWPGLGRLMLDGILARDFPLVQGSVLLIALVFVLVNLAVDLLYAYVDPRIRYQ